MSKRRIDFPAGRIVVKRIKTGDAQLVQPRMMTVTDLEQLDINLNRKDNLSRGVVKLEFIEDKDAVENLDSSEHGSVNSEFVAQESLDSLRDGFSQELNGGQTVYLVKKAVVGGAGVAQSATTNTRNVIVLDCANIEADDMGHSVDESADQPLTTSMLILKDIDITTKIGSLVSLMQSTAIIGSSTVIREILLQDLQQLDPEKSLALQCISAKGRVQVEMELRTFADGSVTINIIDIVRSSQEPVRAKADCVSATPRVAKIRKEKPPELEESLRFVESFDFNAMKAVMNIPNYFSEWTVEHVQLWLNWAKQHFDLSNLETEQVVMTGKDIFTFDADVIMNALGLTDPMFENHLKLLKELNMITVADAVITSDKASSGRGNRTGNNGQVQLWQFLLELLIDRGFQGIIRWDPQASEEGAFIIHDHNSLAKLWGQRKNKPTMTYEKMSRAMRYYYENNLIKKVSGKKYGYQFVCDLKQMIGYSANEIRRILDRGPLSTADEQQLEQLREMLRTPGGVKKVVHQLPDTDDPQSLDCVNVQEALGSDYLIQWDEASN